MSKTGAEPRAAPRHAAATALARATGMRDWARYSKSKSSTARITAETGVPKVAAIPAAAPAARRALRS